ncbi:unnamed protein product [Adineta steineri]|uniref:Uncharacterized protein n=1 Tax=Adineta steineri TaxID=433720 RepID=A0A814T9A4_9BILA|nr:unnamed protein product [Adineta steineri]
MAMVNNKTHCFTCNKEKITYSCEGCAKKFCLIHLTEHRQILTSELHHVTDEYNEFKQTINEQKQNPQNGLLIKQVNQWEIESIEIIHQKAREYREILIKSSEMFINDIEKKLKDLNEQIKEIHQENEFNEINLNYLRNQLRKITEELNNSSNISIKEDSQSFISEVSIITSKKSKSNKWKQNAITVAGGNGQGHKRNQLKSPHGIFIDKKKHIFIADCFNHRIAKWECNAKEEQIIVGANKQGNQINQLDQPKDVVVDQQNHSIIIADQNNRRVIRWMNQNQQILIHNIDCSRLAMDKYGYLYVSDYKKNEVRRWKMGEYNNEGIVVAGENGKGDQFIQLNSRCFIFVDGHQSVYVSDQNNHRVMKWKKGAKEGTVVAGGNGQGRELNQLSKPEGVIVDDLGQIYVVDCWNDRIMRWRDGNEEGVVVVGGNGGGSQLNQLNCPMGLSFDDEGNLYVADSRNHRIQKFEIIL